MAADQATICASKWLHCFGIYETRLFVCFNNGDCAHYFLDDLTSNLHYINLQASASRGRYVNQFLGRGAQRQPGPEVPYHKILCPCTLILSTPSVSYLGQLRAPGLIQLLGAGPWPGISIGDNVTGPNVPPGSTVLLIVGPIITLSLPYAGPNTTAVYTFS